MAGFREHVSVSAMLGIAYGAGTSVFGPLNFVQGALAGWLTALGGMVPDLDSPTSRPIRELFGLVAGIAPLLLAGRLLRWLGLPSNPESVILTVVLLYLAIRYGGSDLIKHVAKHRGMFHSLPALLITAELVFLTYPSGSGSVRMMMAGGIAIGFFSHLLLDEIYSVEMKGGRLRLKKSAGTALKWHGPAFLPNVFCYAMCLLLTYAAFVDVGWVEFTPTDAPGPLADADELLGPPSVAADELAEATR